MCRAFEEYGKEQRAAGITEGLSKGENKKAREVAKIMLSDSSISREQISKFTGLTPAQIKQLEK